MSDLRKAVNEVFAATARYVIEQYGDALYALGHSDSCSDCRTVSDAIAHRGRIDSELDSLEARMAALDSKRW